MFNLIHRTVSLVVIIALASLPLSLMCQSLEEFNGPFDSWADVKKQFGAKGNGKDDDTQAIQRAVDGLAVKDAKGKSYHVLYFPAGTYCITGTIYIRGKLGVALIGESPANTIIKWIGPDGGSLLFGNGSAFYKISRFTLDANHKKFIEGIGIHWRDRWSTPQSESHASLNIEISDVVVTGDCWRGIGGGTNPGEGTGANDSEISIKRCVFNNCSEAGVRTTGYNALDYWIWDCTFLNCMVGIKSDYGNFHAYRCYFKGSLIYDAFSNMGYYKSMRGCYSDNSRGIMGDDGFSINPFKRILQGNTVVRPKSFPLQFYHMGAIAMYDNFFDKSVDTSVHTFVKTSGSVISINNAYASGSAVQFVTPAALRTISDKRLAKIAQSPATFLLQQTKTPALLKRTVFEVAAGATATQIQQLIIAAAKLTGKRPIIHFPGGEFLLDRTLTIPAGSDMQIKGDGWLEATVLLPAKNFSGTALISVAGPSSVTFSEFQMGKFENTKTAIDAIVFSNADQADARAFIDQLYTFANHAVSAEGVDNLYLQKDNSFFADNDFISGGAATRAGHGSAGIFGYGGQFMGVNVQDKSKVVYKDCWWEGSERLPLNIAGSGNITIDGAMIAPAKADSSISVSVNAFSGKLSLMNMYLQGAVQVKAANPTLQLLLMNIHFGYKLDPLKELKGNASYKALFTGITSQCFVAGDKKCDMTINQIPDATVGVTDASGFVSGMMADDRSSMPVRYEWKNASASNTMISRVSIGGFNRALRFLK